MEGTSFEADRSLLQSRRKRSFSLPRFGRSSAGEQPNSATRSVEEGAKTAEDAVRAQKAAAWQWYTRGVGEAVLPTKRPSSATPSGSKCALDKSGIKGEQHIVQKKHLEAPLAAASPRVSRFKAEASTFDGSISGNAQQRPPAATPSTPLYDEFELSGLRTQMVNFVQRLQEEQPKGERQPPATVNVAEGTKFIKSPGPVATAAASTDHLLTSKGPPAAAAESGRASAAANIAGHRLTKPISSSIPVNPTIPFPMRPFATLHRLFRKVVFGSILKSSKTSSITRSPPTPDATCYPEVLACEEEDTQYHHHRYIHHHHHHHHYHYGQTPEESAAAFRSRQRHSESSGIRPHIPSILESGSDEEEEVERSPIDAFLARRRRRHSDSFSLYQTSKEADFDGKMRVKVEAEKAAAPPRRYNAERFSPNKIRANEKKDVQAEAASPGGRDDFQERLLNMNSRRRYSADHHNSRPAGANHLAGLEKKMGGGSGKIGGRTYKLGRGEEVARPVVARHVLVGRRRHSEGFERQPEEAARYEMEKSTPSPAGRPYWHSPSARYLDAVLERRMGLSATAANGGSSA